MLGLAQHLVEFGPVDQANGLTVGKLIRFFGEVAGGDDEGALGSLVDHDPEELSDHRNTNPLRLPVLALDQITLPVLAKVHIDTTVWSVIPTIDYAVTRLSEGFPNQQLELTPAHLGGRLSAALRGALSRYLCFRRGYVPLT
nr:hypothetical protein [Marinobacterium mangrovicola]